jgi:hypothetical protein
MATTPKLITSTSWRENRSPSFNNNRTQIFTNTQWAVTTDGYNPKVDNINKLKRKQQVTIFQQEQHDRANELRHNFVIPFHKIKKNSLNKSDFKFLLNASTVWTARSPAMSSLFHSFPA